MKRSLLPSLKPLLIVALLLAMTSCGVVRKKTTYGARNNPSVTVPASPETSTSDSSADAERLTTSEDSEDVKESRADHRFKNEAQADAIISTAMDYTGTRYKYGGTTRKGMDCSGLLYVAFGAHDFSIPRVSIEMSKMGRKVRVQNLRKGDLVFFTTTRRGRRINHVGLVVAANGDDIRFIHSTSSRGVIVSSLREGYWNSAFVKATRIL